MNKYREFNKKSVQYCFTLKEFLKKTLLLVQQMSLCERRCIIEHNTKANFKV